MKKSERLEHYRRKAENYFALCDRENDGCDAKSGLAKPYTLSGLLCALDLTKDEFYALEKSSKGKKLVRYVLMKIEAFIEENALSGRLSANFAQSTLKNSFGWGEKPAAEVPSVSVTVCDEALKMGE